MRRFLRAAWPFVEPKPLAEGFYVDALADHLDAQLRGEIRNLIICIRPKLGKSTIGSAILPAYIWAKLRQDGPYCGPQVKIFSSSYSDKWVVRDAIKTRALIESPWYRARWGHRFELTSDQNQKSFYQNDQGGHRIALPMGGQGTGAGGDILIGDDLLSFLQSLSPAARELAWSIFEAVFLAQRIDADQSPVLLIGQRLDRDDITGRILERYPKGTWDMLCLETERRMYQVPQHLVMTPAPGVTSTALSRSGRYADPRQPGELIAPARFSEAYIAQQKSNLINWMAQDQQDPIARNAGDRKLQAFDASIHAALPAWRIVDPSDLAWKFGLGLDHGDGRGRQVCALIAWNDTLKRAIVIAEYVSPRATTPEADAVAILAMLAENGIPIRRIDRVIGDVNSSFKGDGDTINVKFGILLDFKVTKPQKPAGSVETGLMLIDQALRSNGLSVDPDCERVAESFALHAKPGDQWSHACDAVRYLLAARREDDPHPSILESWILPESEEGAAFY